MAHYAFLDDNNIVTEVIVGINETETIEGLDTEIWYGNFRGQMCKRTSYHANIRGKYAGIGDFYNENEDIFIAPQPYKSWVRFGSFWQPPIPYPNEDAKSFIWDESLIAWVETSE
jgi:hypothetical protein